MRLIDLKITKSDYLALPHISTFTVVDMKECLPLGTKFKYADGHVGELVKGGDMIADQWGAGLSVPERGIVHYKPVFIPEPLKLATP